MNMSTNQIHEWNAKWCLFIYIYIFFFSNVSSSLTPSYVWNTHCDEILGTQTGENVTQMSNLMIQSLTCHLMFYKHWGSNKGEHYQWQTCFGKVLIKSAKVHSAKNLLFPKLLRGQLVWFLRHLLASIAK